MTDIGIELSARSFLIGVVIDRSNLNDLLNSIDDDSAIEILAAMITLA
jgi:hypothetical protein